jgi:malonate-semialdehyde dehydrogenase (acetylating)/methylmalonate-semialdehyde dehydrogenase
VQGDKVAVDRLLEHPDIEAVSFVGSTPIAKYIYETGHRQRQAGAGLGGAKNHMLVLPDADLDAAADAAVSAGYGSAGRALHGDQRRARRRLDRRRAGRQDRRADPAIKVGPGNEPDNEMGPLITGEHRDKVASYARGRSRGGSTVVVDGRSGAAPDQGFFLNPSLIDDVQPGMACYDDEIFGPVLSVVRVAGYQEGIDLINSNPYANGVALFTRDGARPRQFQFDVQVGMVGSTFRSRAGELLQLRRLEGEPLRRHPHVRSGGHQLLHARQGRHVALARPLDVHVDLGFPQN